MTKNESTRSITPAGYEKKKRCCTVCDAKNLCSVCNDATLYACSDCQIDLAATVYVCPKPACRDAHEPKCPFHLKAENESLKAERDRALEVIREYRRDDIRANSCVVRMAGVNGTQIDDRCPTCIKADALLSRELKET